MIEYIIKIKRKTKSLLRDPWVWRMAWRDGRHNASRLFLFIASMITGIAAVVAISSLNYSMQQELNRNAKELLGADLVIKSNKKFDSTFTALLDSAAIQQAANADMASMVMFMNTGQSRLVKLTALEGDFPFYGDLITLPADSYAKVRTGRYAMLDESLATQYEVSSDDSIKVGSSVFRVAGVVRKIPGGGELTSTIAPVVYIALSELDSTGLVQYGSRVNYNLFIKTKTEQETTDLLKRLRPEMKQRGYSFDTVEERKNDLGNGFRSVYRFFSLLAFVALVLGCIGVASSVHIYAREKRDEVAILRCVGSSGWQAFNIYFIQVFALGLAGSVLGAALGVGLQQLIPLAFGGLLPVELKFNVQWVAVGEGLILGVLISVLFTVLPLVAVRFVP
ncbi:MAG: ABC transporter permease, partial [Cyclobacteriaceae bacterium]